MSAGPFYTFTFPTNSLRYGLALPPKDPDSVRSYTLDATAFLTAAGRTIASAFVQRDPSLSAGGVSHTDTTVSVTVGGGSTGTPYPVLAFV